MLCEWRTTRPKLRRFAQLLPLERKCGGDANKCSPNANRRHSVYDKLLAAAMRLSAPQPLRALQGASVKRAPATTSRVAIGSGGQGRYIKDLLGNVYREHWCNVYPFIHATIGCCSTCKRCDARAARRERNWRASSSTAGPSRKLVGKPGGAPLCNKWHGECSADMTQPQAATCTAIAKHP